jgi:hypothetical protein
MTPRKLPDVLIVCAYGLAMIALALLVWLGPAAYGVMLLLGGHVGAGAILAGLGACWAVLLAVDKTLPGMLLGAVHSILIFVGIAEDPWYGER